MKTILIIDNKVFTKDEDLLFYFQPSSCILFYFAFYSILKNELSHDQKNSRR